jgi:uncharacterized protein
MVSADHLRIEVLYCAGPDLTDRTPLNLPQGATVADALRASGLQQRHGALVEGLRIGVWNKLKELDTPLRDGDRVELYRPLLVDPKEARRQRYQQHRQNQAAREEKKKPRLSGSST